MGVLISDWAAIEEIIYHGYCADREEAAVRSAEAGVDIDMMTGIYCENLCRLVREGKISEDLIDESCMRILELKNKLGDVYKRQPQKRGGKVAAAIWPWKCKDALFRFNEAADTRLNQDGMAYDADSGDGTVYEYNFSRQNEGGCCLLYTSVGKRMHQIIFVDV